RAAVYPLSLPDALPSSGSSPSGPGRPALPESGLESGLLVLRMSHALTLRFPDLSKSTLKLHSDAVAAHGIHRSALADARSDWVRDRKSTRLNSSHVKIS